MLVAPISAPPSLGDLLLLPPAGRLPDRRVHRLVARRDGLLVTRGDANPDVDAPLRADEALGRVVAVGRGASHWRRLDSSRARAAGKLAAVGFRLLDSLGDTPRLNSLLARAAAGLRNAHRPWALLRTQGPALKPLRAAWLDLWLACERRESAPATARDVLGAAWARAAAWLALG